MTLKELRLPVLLLTGLTLAAAATARAWETEQISRTLPITADGTIVVDNVNGSIEIVAWDKPEVSLEAEIRGKSLEDLKRQRVEIEAGASRIVIKTVREKRKVFLWGDEPRGEVNYKLRVPATVSLEKIDSVNSSIKVEGVRGKVDLDTVNGRITATGLAADGRFDTVNGSITAEYDSLAGVNKVVLDTVNGSCTLRLPSEINARVRASSVNGSISCDFPIKLEKSGRHSLRGTIGTGATDIAMESVNGGLRIGSR